MELDAFGEEDFDVKAWVNQQVRSSSQLAEAAGNVKGTNVDDHLATLIVKLQLLSQGAGKAIDDSSRSLLTELPHAMVEIERVGSDAALLAQQMAQVLDKVSEVERSGQQTVAALATLDAIKSRMEECASVLAEAQSVSNTLAQIEPLFQVDELGSIASRLGSLRRSLDTMGHLEEFSGARERLGQFEDRLEKRVSSKLKEGIESHDSGATKECLQIYEQMQRRDMLITRYTQTRKPTLVKVYAAFASGEPAPAPEHGHPPPFADKLHSLRQDLIAGLGVELAWCVEVFPDSGKFAAALWTDLISTIGEPLQGNINDKIFKGDFGEGELKQMAAVHACVVEMAVQAAEMLTRDTLPGAKPEVEEVLKVSLSVMEKCQREYPAKEGKVLEKLAVRWKSDVTRSTSIAEGLRIVEDASAKFFSHLHHAATRAFALTSGGEAMAIARVLDEAVSALLDAFRAAVLHFRAIAGVDGGEGGGSKDKEKDSKATKGTPAKEALSAEEEEDELLGDGDLPGADAAEYDWGYLQGALALLKVADTVKEKLKELDADVRDQTGRYAKGLFATATLESVRKQPPCMYIRSDKQRLPALEKFISRAQSREFITLVRSPSVLQTVHGKVEEFLLDTALSFVRKQLVGVGKLRVWGETKKSKAHLPSFSSSPLSYVTKIAEHLFSLPDQLDQSGGEDGGDEGSAESAFMQHWLARITGGVVHLYVETILSIPTLSPSGRTQLATDMQYLTSILSTLGAPALHRLEDLLKLVEATDEGFAGACMAVTSLDRAAIDKMARKRQPMA